MKTWFLFLVSKKRQKNDESKFESKSAEIIVDIIFM